MSGRPWLALVAAAAALLVGLAIALAGGGSSSGPPATGPAASAATDSGFDGAALPLTAPVGDFTLTDQSGRRVSLSSLRGRVTIVAFIYASCPAACVLIAQQIRGALDEVSGPVATVFLSVDPAGDTPARVSAFLRRVSLAGRVEYLTGPRAVLAGIWRAYRIVPASAGEGAYARSASVLLLDRRGRERVVFQLEQLTGESLTHDVRRLQSEP